MKEDKEILFVCFENAGRSQMATAFAEKYGLKALSAGVFPAGRVNPIVIEAMKEKGIDISSTPRMVTPEMINGASLIVTIGCRLDEVCPKPMLAQLQKKLIDWNFKDPRDKSLAEVRAIRDDIEKRVIELSKRI
jgi:arsenate reductase (thioredoxin)